MLMMASNGFTGMPTLKLLTYLSILIHDVLREIDMNCLADEIETEYERYGTPVIDVCTVPQKEWVLHAPLLPYEAHCTNPA